MTKVRLFVSPLFNALFNLNDEGLEEIRKNLRGVWDAKEVLIMEGFSQVTGLSFKHNYIDVFLVRRDAVARSISYPIILRVGGDMERNMCILIHELAHNLMWDNEQESNWSKKALALWPQETHSAARHIVVHAIMEAIYVGVVKDLEEIAKDIEICQKSPDYKRAWGIVKEKGYRNIIDMLKQ